MNVAARDATAQKLVVQVVGLAKKVLQLNTDVASRKLTSIVQDVLHKIEQYSTATRSQEVPNLKRS